MTPPPSAPVSLYVFPIEEGEFTIGFDRVVTLKAEAREMAEISA
jgi:hypothetical protein